MGEVPSFCKRDNGFDPETMLCQALEDAWRRAAVSGNSFAQRAARPSSKNAISIAPHDAMHLKSGTPRS
jgi:hypothetical protein